MRTGLPRPPQILGALALCASAPAFAFTLGNIEVRSALDEPLDARIPIAASAGDGLAGACFTLTPPGVPGAPHLHGGSLGLRRSAKGAYLRVRSSAPVREPAILVGIAIACPGQPPQETRRYSILLDPRHRIAAPVAAESLTARQGDTLESVAATIFRRNASARHDYLEALRTANPALAALGDGAPIAAGSLIALPDLRTFARSRHAPGTAHVPGPAALEGAPPSGIAAPKPRAARPAKLTGHPPAPEPRKSAAAATPLRSAASAGHARATPGPGFQLKLSAPVVDLSPSRAMDDRTRAQLRERLAVLDADDQVAAMLSMRNNLHQLEAEVQQLRLKLAEVPAAMPKAAAVPQPSVAPAAVPPPEVNAAPPSAAPAPPAKAAAPAVPPSTVPSEPPPAMPAEAAAPSPSSPAATKPPAPVIAKPPAAALAPIGAAPKGSTAPPWTESYELWAGLALVLVLVAAAAVYLRRRRSASGAPEESWEAPADAPMDIAPERAPLDEEPAAVHEAPRGEVASDAELTTRIPEENADDLRRRYMEERFPETVNRTIALDDADSVVKGARLFYEDGALPRAVELLQFAIEANPAQVKFWLALFEIFRLERLPGEFAELARPLPRAARQGDYWREGAVLRPRDRSGQRALPDESADQPRDHRPARRRGRSRAARTSTRSRRTGSAPPWISRTRCSPTNCAVP